MTAADHITRLSLQPHPEGGFYRETYRAAYPVTPQGDAALAPTTTSTVPVTDLSAPTIPSTSASAVTSAVTSIHYLLQDDDFSGFHRIAYPELWYFHDGDPLVIHEIDEAGVYRARTLGRGSDQHLSLAVEPGTWFAAELLRDAALLPAGGNADTRPERFALVSCAVAPAFDFANFELAKRAAMIATYPQHADILARLCRE